jgi:hypothetical protein
MPLGIVGVSMGAGARNLCLALFGLQLAGCAASETSSFVSANDIPVNKYHHIAVFVENVEGAEQSGAEQIIISNLTSAGVNADSGTTTINSKGKQLSEKQKALVIQNSFDAVLYVAVMEKGLVEELVPYAEHNGQVITFHVSVLSGLLDLGTTVPIDENTNARFVLKEDGSVYQRVFALKTKSDLQDTKTAKQVWTAETISSGNATVTNMNIVFVGASKQIVEKMQADHAI